MFGNLLRRTKTARPRKEAAVPLKPRIEHPESARPARPRPRPQTDSAGGQLIDVIEDRKDIPLGQYVNFEHCGIPRSFAESFALIQTGPASASLLTAVEALHSHPQFELQRRIERATDIRSLTIRRASREIVKGVHEANATIPIEKNTIVEDEAWRLIDEAVEANASDIHIEQRGSFARVFFRVYGERLERAQMAASTAEAICNVLYSVHADADNKAGGTWDKKTVMNTVIEHKKPKNNKRVQLRFSSSPIHPSGNFHAVIRILVMEESSERPLEDVGFTKEQCQAIEEMLVGSQGMLLVVGPTNSGKSTTMKSCVSRVYDMRGTSIKVLTVEDPVEYIISHACQMGVPEGRKNLQDQATGSIYSTFIRGMLRQDPDVCLIGEIRDGESAKHVKDLVLAGRKLLTTLHVDNVYTVYPRLREMGVPDSVLYMDNFISGVVCQRLVPLLCPHCCITMDQALQQKRLRRATYDRVIECLGNDHEDVRCRGDGCEHCNYMGIVGRTPCAELLVPDSHFLHLMSSGKWSEAQAYWKRSSPHLAVEGRGVTMIAHALSKLRVGAVDPSHVESQVGPLIAGRQVLHKGAGTVSDSSELSLSELPAPPSMPRETDATTFGSSGSPSGAGVIPLQISL